MFLSPTNALVGDKNISFIKMHGATIKKLWMECFSVLSMWLGCFSDPVRWQSP